MGNLNKHILQSGVSRRSILQGAAAIGGAAVAGQFAIGPAAAQPKKGGTFRVGITAGNTSEKDQPLILASIGKFPS